MVATEGATARAATATTGTQARAQALQASPSAKAESISVTGSQTVNRAGSVSTRQHSTTSVQVISADELKNTGQTNVIAALEQLAPSVSSPSFSGIGANGFVRTMQLRNLSADQTLILVNGKRRHRSSNVNINSGPNYGTEPADLALIPMSAIDHVEVIEEGATALYGQDAIAGAVNIVLKHNTSGGSFSIQDSGYYAGDGVGVDGAADYAVKLGHSGGYLDFAGQVTHTQPANRSGPYTGSTFLPLANGSPDPRAAAMGTDINRILGSGRTMLETFSMNGALPLGHNMELYTTDTYSHRDVTTPQAVRTQSNDSTVRALYPLGFAPQMGMTENDFEVTGGVRGSFRKAWHWDAFVTFGRDDERDSTLNSDNPTYGLASQKNFYDGSYVNSEFDSGFKISRNFNTALLPKPINFEFGGDYRHESYQLIAGETQSWANGGVAILDGPHAGNPTTAGASGHIGTSPENASATSRDIYEGHANLDFYLTPKWEWSLGGRVASYSSMATVETGSVATRYNFTRRFAIRANFNTGYRPPTLGEMNYYLTITSPTYASAQLPSNSNGARALGSSGLSGEYSRSYSIGIDSTPVNNMHITANLYRIAINDRIANTTKFGGSAVENILAGQGINGVQYVQYFANPVNTVTNGGDVNLDYTFHPRHAGTVRVNVGVNFSDTEIGSYNATPSVLQNLNLSYFNNVAKSVLLDSSPRNRETLGVLWNIGRLSVSVQEQRYGQTVFIASPSLATKDWTLTRPGYITNLEVGYNVFDRWHIAAGANNLFNYYPNHTSQAAAASYSGAFIYPYSSPYGFFGGYYYIKSSIRF
ncbi:TonB-dependent receptor domain-containing protein [Komagataeibacter xylinus]|uniref:TonB-dependent receptor plug domain-containing protein n=1 Tax=Komagataeibacter xylinus TaxID=28448 RepID=UPI00280A5ACA|nr:TonB-dependent receptor [Komagataeibacter xylinus]